MIPDSVTSIGVAFEGCDNLTAINVDTNNPTFSSVAGVLFNKSQTLLIECPGALAGAYAVPSSVTGIGSQAFWGCSSLTIVTIPNSVTNLEDLTFMYCSSLASVTMGNGVVSIPYEAFSGCSSLASVTIPNSVTSIGDSAFDSCTSLTSVTIPDSVTSIGDGAFAGCGLTSITIPKSVTNIGEEAFAGCPSLANITVNPFNSAYSSLNGVLFNKGQTMLIQYPIGNVATSYTIPNSVTIIGYEAFYFCTSLTSVTIGNSVTSIGGDAFYGCGLASVNLPASVTTIGYDAFEDCFSLTNVTISHGVTSIELGAFSVCTSLANLTIPDSVTNIGDTAFWGCTNLTGIFFLGNAPSLGGVNVFTGDSNLIVYYVPGTAGWGTTFGGVRTAPWIQVPIILVPPRTQTAEAGSAVSLRVQASSPLPLFYLWYFNHTYLVESGTNWQLELTNVQFAQSGAYAVVVSNVLGAVTSAPAMLNVIAPVERRPVPGVTVTGEAASLLNVDYADSLSPAPNWTPLGSVSLTGPSQYCFDLTLPLPPQRFYRAWQTGTPGVRPSLDLHLVPAVTLTGSIGGSVRLDYINQFGPIDAWVTLAMVTLTNTSQLYFDTSAPGQPHRLYRLVPSP